MLYVIRFIFLRIPINCRKLMEIKFNKVVLEVKALQNMYRLDVMPRKIHYVVLVAQHAFM